MNIETPNTKDWQGMDADHHLHPFTDTGALNQKGARIIVRADGCYVWDSDGTRLLDGMAGLWCVNVGYGREELVEAAARQMRELPYYNTFFQSTTPPAVELADKLSAIAPDGLSHVFFANSGSEANDTVVRLVRTFWQVEGKPEKQTIIGRTYGYHGSTMASASLCGMTPMHEQGGLPLPGFNHIMPPYAYYMMKDGETEAEFGIRAAEALDDRIQMLGPDTVAAFIAEPIQGAGGVIVPPATYWPLIQEICKKHDVLLIADEVICGFGRTGEWFGSQVFDIKPDLMPIAKGLSSGYLPISGLMVGDRIADCLIKGTGEFTHGFTYSGHPVAAAVALKNLEIIERENLVGRVRDDIGPYFQAAVRGLGDHPLVGEVRGIGMLAAIELVKDKATKTPFDPSADVAVTCREYCMENGLIMRAVRDAMILSPPLIITHEQVDEIVRVARLALDKTAAKVL